ncbi:MAG: DUF4105 domain-containing protein [Treponema sp.]|nr:DUF4105 domain-containing protein [Treponema sp.]
MAKKTVFVFILIFFSTAMLFAGGEHLTIKVAVVGPGTPLYFWWGHIALVIEDSNTGRSYFYDYGIFSLDNDYFFQNFALGRLLFTSGVSSTERNIEVYRLTNRSLVFYTLNLPPETRLKVQELANYDMLPENRDYWYHHFDNNCSTRIIEIIDFATDGQFREYFDNIPSRFTLRQHVRRHTWFSPAVDWALNFWMGQGIDRPITVWDDMFLPSEVGKRIQEFEFTDVNGVRRRLVESEDSIQVIIESTGLPEVLEIPRRQWPMNFAFSLVMSAVLGFFFYLHSKNIRIGRIFAGIGISFFGFVFGVAALMLYFMNIFTDHDYTYQNFNMIFATPLLLAAVPLGICFASTKNLKKLIIYDRLIRLTWLLTVVGILILTLLRLFPSCPIEDIGIFQQNLPDKLLMLPIALLFTFQPVGLCQSLRKCCICKKSA